MISIAALSVPAGGHRTTFVAPGILLLLVIVLNVCPSWAQTPGLIVKPAVAGQSVLDPNLDNYVSATDIGFVSNDELESEIQYKALVLPNVEPTSDLATGPTCGFTDLVDGSGAYSSSYTYLSGAGNWLFRFRVGNYASNSKGYSILVDTDGLFGNTGYYKDPNYVSGNPGFEIEILLVTNIGIRLNDVDGTTTAVTKTTLSYDDYCQKAVAYSTNCSNPDYFYDFYIPVSVITTYFPTFSTSTSVRLVANTVISTQSVLQSGPSDIAGVNDSGYGGNFGNAWTSVVNAAVPTAPSSFNSGFPAVRSATPTVNSPLSTGATTVSGTSTEANGTVITVYVNDVAVGTTTVTGGVWTLSGMTALALSDQVKATATATSKSASYFSTTITVGSTCSLVPTTSCSSNKGVGGSGPTGAAAGTTIRIYGPNVPGTLLTSVTTDASNTFLYNCAGGTTNCTGGGPNCITSGVYWITAQESGKCESPKTVTVCIGTSGTASTPVISTNPILASTTSISGTATSGNTVLLYIDNVYTSSTSATGGSWSFSGLTLTLGQSISVYAVQSTRCISSAATRSVSGTSTAPTVNSPIITGATSVSGTSVEAQGTVITLYKNSVLVTTTTVDANGNWSITGLTALSGGDLISATATASGKAVSVSSSTVTVSSRSSTPAITGSYTEGGTSVSGTSSEATGTTIKVYLDGVLLGSTTVTAGMWSLTGIANTELYPGGSLTATATASGKAESTSSSAVTISCSNPSTSLALSLLSSSVCLNTQSSVQVMLSQSGVIYTLRDNSNTSDMGYSALGTGGTITLKSYRLTANQTFSVKATKIPNTSCNAALAAMASVTVTQPSDISGVTSGDYFWTGSAANNYWTDYTNWVAWNGSAFQTVTVPPTSLQNVIVKPTETCIGNQPSVITSSAATTPALCKNLTIASGATLSLENSASERAITLYGNWSNAGTFVPNAGIIKFAGGTTQTINNTSGTETFGSLIIEGSSTTVQPLVNLVINATGQLTLSGGVLQLSGRTITVNNSSASAITRTGGCIISESQNASAEVKWVIGNNTGTNYVFPMGNASKDYIPVTLNLTSGNIGTVGVNTVFATQSSSAQWPTGSEAVTSVATPAHALRRYWHFSSTQSAGTYNATVTFSFASTEDPTASILDVSTAGMKMQRWDGVSSWNQALTGQSFTYASPIRSVTVPGITSFSWWSGGNPNNYPLPVSLLYFTARTEQAHVRLDWGTPPETDRSSFILERSADGLTYQVIGNVEVRRTVDDQVDYTFVDSHAAPGINYYRILRQPTDGRAAYSHVVSVWLEGAAEAFVFPNPTQGKSPLIVLPAKHEKTATVEIFDRHGICVSSTNNVINVSAEGRIPVPGFDHLPEGVYMVKIVNGVRNWILKVVKN